MDHYRSHDRVQLTRHEAGAEPDELMAEAWARAGVAKVIPNRFGVELRFGAFVGSLELPSGLRLSIDELCLAPRRPVFALPLLACVRLRARVER